jgi:CRISPR/Cas system endoribonuclease Cas6 (RAMP superfamily)
MDTAIALCIAVVKEIVEAVEGDAANTEEAECLKEMAKSIGENLGKLSASDQDHITHLPDLKSVLESTKEYVLRFGKESNGFLAKTQDKVVRIFNHRNHHASFLKLKEVFVFVWPCFPLFLSF